MPAPARAGCNQTPGVIGSRAAARECAMKPHRQAKRRSSPFSACLQQRALAEDGAEVHRHRQARRTQGMADHADGGAGQATASVTSCVTMDEASWQRAISASSKRCIWPLKACPCSGGMGQKPAGGPCRPLADSEQFFSWPRHKNSLPSVLGRLLWPRSKPKRKSSGVWGCAAT